MNLQIRFAKPRGVTLVELIVVIAVAGILASVAAPTVFGAMKRERERQVVNEVANKFREARNQAMARGEAVIVQAGGPQDGSAPGDVSVRRTLVLPPTGGYQEGGITCNPATEGVTTNDCPEGSVCMDDGCWSRPARSCRELIPGQFREVEVSRYDVPEGSGLGIRLANAEGGGTNRVCFSPDGRALAPGGQNMLPTYPTEACDNEGYLVMFGALDTTIPWGTYSSQTTCASTAADYESVNGYVLRINDNGEIGLRSHAQ